MMIKLTDSYKHQGMRRNLLNELRKLGITNEQVLQAMYDVPRHYFLEPAFLKYAYLNQAFQIGAGQTISQPYTVAFQSSLLEIKKWDKILEIGTGSGYQTAVLHKLGAKVFSIERQRELHTKAKEFLPKIGVNTRLFYGDGYKGLPQFAPFDKVIITCGAPFLPEALKEQVKVGGLIVIPVGEANEQTMYRIRKTSETTFEEESYGKFSFVPFLEDKE